MTIPLSIRETRNSQSVAVGKASYEYLIAGTSSRSTAVALAQAAAPATVTDPEGTTLYPNDWPADPAGYRAWTVRVDYAKRDPSLAEEVSFDISTETVTITQSLQTVNKYAAPGDVAPDFRGAIGVEGDTVKGASVLSPKASYTITAKLAASAVTGAYQLALYNLVGKKNAAAFRGAKAGEILFAGARGRKLSAEEWEISFSFLFSQEAANIPVGNINVTLKAGWDYLWVYYTIKKDNAAKRLIQEPTAAYVEKVYEDGDFAGLGISTT